MKRPLPPKADRVIERHVQILELDKHGRIVSHYNYWNKAVISRNPFVIASLITTNFAFVLKIRVVCTYWLRFNMHTPSL